MHIDSIIYIGTPIVPFERISLKLITKSSNRQSKV
jgi:hypothetical protein